MIYFIYIIILKCDKHNTQFISNWFLNITLYICCLDDC